MVGIGKTRSLYSASVAGTKAEVIATDVDIAGYHLLNETAAVAYVQVFYKLAAAVTVGTTTPDVVIPLPASGGATMKFEGKGWRIPTALTLAATTTSGGATGAACFITLFRSV